MKISRGFTVIEGLLILIIIGLLAGIGWYVWDHHKKTIPSTTTAANQTTTTATPTLKTTTLPVSNISFQYPSNWTIDTENMDLNHTGVTMYMTTLNSTSNHTGDWLSMEIYYTDAPFSTNPVKCGDYCTVLSADDVTVSSKAAKLLETSSSQVDPSQANDVFQMFLSDDTAIKVGDKNADGKIVVGKGYVTTFTKLYRGGSDGPQQNYPVPASQFNSRADVKDAKAVLASIKF